MEALALQLFQAQQGWHPAPTESYANAFDFTQLSMLIAAQQQTQQQQQNCPPPNYTKPQRSVSLTLPTDRQPFQDLHAHVYGVNPPQHSPQQQAPMYSKPSSGVSSRSVSSSGGRWAAATDQRDVVITEQLGLIKNLNDTISTQKQAAVEQDAVRCALEVQVAEMRKLLASASGSSAASSADSDEGNFTTEAQVAYYKEHAEQWSGRSTLDRQQLIQVLRTLIASNKRYQQPLPPMCVKPDCRCRNCWFLHAHIDETAWAAAWELHMSLR